MLGHTEQCILLLIFYARTCAMQTKAWHSALTLVFVSMHYAAPLSHFVPVQMVHFAWPRNIPRHPVHTCTRTRILIRYKSSITINTVVIQCNYILAALSYQLILAK